MRKELSNSSSHEEKTHWLRKWFTIIPIVITVSVGLLVYLGYKEPAVETNSNALKLKGLYGVNILFSEIAEADTISWREMPAIALRTNGISLNKVHRGKFRTTQDEKIHLNIYRGIGPIIKIVEQNGSVYYINRKSAEETKQIFNNLKINTIKK
jgi:hypothetical protein